MRGLARVATLVASAWIGAACMVCTARAAATDSPRSATSPDCSACLIIPIDHGQLTVTPVAPNIVRLQFRHGPSRASDTAAGAAPSLVLDPAWQPATMPGARLFKRVTTQELDAGALRVVWDAARRELRVDDAQHRPLLRQHDLTSLAQGQLHLTHDALDPMYGIGGYNATDDVSAGLLRQGERRAVAGTQGHAGAPFVWSTAGYGLLVNSRGVGFRLDDGRMDVHMPIGDIDYFIVLGQPAELFAAIAQLSGHTPLFPKWAMGFTNSQWNIDQAELLSIVDTYRRKHIPIDNFTLDFDWKAWGEDDYGEFRWNAVKFPDGPSGRLKAMLDQRGMHLTGIMKPRVHVDSVEGRYATTHDLWLPDVAVSNDYFSHKPVRVIDFDKPAARAWFFNDALKHSFDTGIVGWWNDEADDSGSDTQFLNMQRALYDGQRAYSDQRVWSVNRNFWLGAQRYAYGLWSGDIATGFASMAGQRARMLSAIDVGAMQWGMDGGGFTKGHPTNENYARWVEFGAFTPIFRVHGDFNEKRQPWLYGADAEAAATDAIRLRYALIPYIYSYEARRRVDGVGLVRPLTFDWPDDPQVRNDVDAWLFGDSLLVSPVVVQGQASKDIYLPAGTWTDWFSGKVYRGGQRVHLAIDSAHWHDIPLFIRQGAIVPMQPAMDYVGQHPVTQLDVQMFPDDRRRTFEYYDDDGSTYAYERGASFRQPLAMQRRGRTIHVQIGAAVGSYTPALAFYLLKIHAGAARAVSRGQAALPAFDSLGALSASAGEGWSHGHDVYGDVTYVRVKAALAQDIVLSLDGTAAPRP
jgi:alpha-glucosidase